LYLQGAIEEDCMKTLAPHYVGDWESRGAALRLRGLNRLGDLLVPNLNYVALEEWFMPLLRAMHDEQGGGEDGRSPLRRVWTPSAVIARLGAALTDEGSILYWAARNRIPVFCPGLTDGAIGDMLFFHSWDRPGFLLDVAGDVRRINKAAMRAKKSGMLILGGGTPKHHTCNANLMRNGADFAVFVNTGAEFDGSDAGARPDEAVSWGKIRLDARPVKVHADATLVLPLIVAHTWAPARDAALAAAAAGASAGAGAGVGAGAGSAAADAADALAHGWAAAAEDDDDEDALFAFAHAEAAVRGAREKAAAKAAATAAAAAT
jgi:deoxyhypusine synthase